MPRLVLVAFAQAVTKHPSGEIDLRGIAPGITMPPPQPGTINWVSAVCVFILLADLAAGPHTLVVRFGPVDDPYPLLLGEEMPFEVAESQGYIDVSLQPRLPIKTPGWQRLDVVVDGEVLGHGVLNVVQE